MLEKITPQKLQFSGSVIITLSIFAIFSLLPTPVTALQNDDPPLPEFQGTIVDDLSDSFSLHGPRNYWHATELGYAGHSWWTKNNRLDVENTGRWSLAIPNPGEYKIAVYIPPNHATSETARYTLFHQNNSTSISVNQLRHQNSWVVLGTYTFDGSGNEYLELQDATGEPDGKVELGFDAVGFSSHKPGLEEKAAEALADAVSNAVWDRIRMWLDDHTDELRAEVKVWFQQQKGKLLRQAGDSATTWIDRQCTGLGAAMLLPGAALVLWARKRPKN
jgi:hypothetical protein